MINYRKARDVIQATAAGMAVGLESFSYLLFFSFSFSFSFGTCSSSLAATAVAAIASTVFVLYYRNRLNLFLCRMPMYITLSRLQLTPTQIQRKSRAATSTTTIFVFINLGFCCLNSIATLDPLHSSFCASFHCSPEQTIENRAQHFFPSLAVSSFDFLFVFVSFFVNFVMACTNVYIILYPFRSKLLCSMLQLIREWNWIKNREWLAHLTLPLLGSVHFVANAGERTAPTNDSLEIEYVSAECSITTFFFLEFFSSTAVDRKRLRKM